MYDCENPTDDDDKLEPINQDLDRLQNDLFEQYDATVAPIVKVLITVETTQATFFADKSYMTSHARFQAVSHQYMIHPQTNFNENQPNVCIIL